MPRFLTALLCAALLCAVTLTLPVAGTGWAPQPGPLTTRWGQAVSPGDVHPEYPRPQLVRERGQNLNGRWSYAITPEGAPQPRRWEGRILVPFPVESALSGVRRPLGETPCAEAEEL